MTIVTSPTLAGSPRRNWWRKHKKSSRIRNLRPDNMRHHMKQQHPACWEDYQKLGDDKRCKYMLAARATRSDIMVMTVPSLVYEPFTPNIVSDLIADVLFQATSDGHKYKSQLFGVWTTDPVVKMPLCAQMLINRLSNEVFFKNLNRQFEEPFTGLCNRHFMTALTMRTANFCPQRILIHKMYVEMCLKFERSPWRSIANVLA
ncbi:hypothetical protein KXD40_001035 [Peronospora effusa]|nr:hypothetical protein KXD40_001035 [Peronospora effusa]